MHFKRRPSSSAAHGYGSLTQGEDCKTELDTHEPDLSGVSATRSHGGPSGVRAPGPAASKGGQSRGANGAPRGEVWEQSFSMSPEVRFTRTPERVLKERRMKGASHLADDSFEEQARQIAATRMDDPAPAVQERLQALRSKAASQETGAGSALIFNRAPAPERGPITRAATPASTMEAVPRRAPVGGSAHSQNAVEQPAQPAKSSPVAPAP